MSRVKMIIFKNKHYFSFSLDLKMLKLTTSYFKNLLFSKLFKFYSPQYFLVDWKKKFLQMFLGWISNWILPFYKQKPS